MKQLASALTALGLLFLGIIFFPLLILYYCAKNSK